MEWKQCYYELLKFLEIDQMLCITWSATWSYMWSFISSLNKWSFFLELCIRWSEKNVLTVGSTFIFNFNLFTPLRIKLLIGRREGSHMATKFFETSVHNQLKSWKWGLRLCMFLFSSSLLYYQQFLILFQTMRE